MALCAAKWPARTLKTMLALSLCFFVASAGARQMVSVARDTVNMRSGAGTGHEVLWELGRGYPLRVLKKRGHWLKVRDFENDEGWVYRALTGSVPHHVVKVHVANIRSRPSTRSRIVGKAPYGTLLRTLKRKGAWVKVKSEDDTTGWIARRLLWGW